MKNIILIGNGGHSNSVKDVIENQKIFNPKYKVTIEKKNLTKPNIFYYSLKNLNYLLSKSKYAHIAFGQITNQKKREHEFNKLQKIGFKFPKIISKFAKISKSVIIGDGTIIMNGVIVNNNSKIGINNIINSGVIIEHDVIIGNHCHIAPGAIINGGVKIGNNCFIGSGTIIKQGTKIGNKKFIQAGRFYYKT